MILADELKSKLKTYRLNEEEYTLMTELLGRAPKPVEWPLFSALWSEHCSYKSSKIHLRQFSYRNASTPDMDGENAGVVDLGYGEKVAFKMESHNHPSFIEPAQGAATGVGGILRDIFTMGARPIMSANYLCFGELQAPRMKYLMNGVVKGISSYGNCVGVPTLTGQTTLHPRYNKNILVNALSVGYFGPEQKMALSKAEGEKNLVVYVGAKTGRDGVHGASMASASFDDDTESKKPNVQIGDPFYEKLLIEACLEVLEKDYVVAMQDMGAAGLTSSSFEMASKGQVGLVIDLKKVPLRDSSMSAEDILLSESQERMLLICKPSHLKPLQDVFKKWSLDAVVLGEVQNKREIILMWGQEILTEIDPDLIVEKAPRYNRPYEVWKSKAQTSQLTKTFQEQNLKSYLLKSLQQHLINSRDWIYNQYDQRVGARTAMACESSVAFVRLDHSTRGLGLAVGCRAQVMLMDAQLGAYDAVYYPAFQLALKGAKTLAVTDCLNFGNPQKKEIMSEFVASVEAIADASRKLDAPVISGNVSFYNETLGENIISTPATGLIGMRPSVDDLIPECFQDQHEHIFKITFYWVQSDLFLNANFEERARFVINPSADVPGFIKKCCELEAEARLKGVQISSLKSVGLGGLAVTCLKMSTDTMGCDLSYESSDHSSVELFQDEFYSFIMTSSMDREKIEKFLNQFFADLSHVSIKKIGETKNDSFKLTNEIEFKLSEIRQNYKMRLDEVGL